MNDKETSTSALPIESPQGVKKPEITPQSEKASKVVNLKIDLPLVTTVKLDTRSTSPITIDFPDTDSTIDQDTDLSYSPGLSPTDVSSSDSITGYSLKSVDEEKLGDLNSIPIVDSVSYDDKLSKVETIEIDSASETDVSVTTGNTSLSENSVSDITDNTSIDKAPLLSVHEQRTRKIKATSSIDILQTYGKEISDQESLAKEAVQEYQSANTEVSKLRQQLENLKTTEQELIESIVPKMSRSITSRFTIGLLTSLSPEPQQQLIKDIGNHLSNRLINNIEDNKEQDEHHKIDRNHSNFLSKSNQETPELKQSRDLLKKALDMSIKKMLGSQIDKSIATSLIEIISTNVSQALIEPISDTELENIRKAVIKNLSRQIKRASVFDNFSPVTAFGENSFLQSGINDLERIAKEKERIKVSISPIMERTNQLALSASSVSQEGLELLKYPKLISDQQLSIIESFALPLEVELYGEKFNKQLKEILSEREKLLKQKTACESQKTDLNSQIDALENQLKSNKLRNEKTTNKLMIKLHLKKKKPEKLTEEMESIQKNIQELDKEIASLSVRRADLYFEKQTLEPIISAIEKQKEKIEQQSKLSEPNALANEIFSKLTRQQILRDGCSDTDGIYQLQSSDNFKNQNLSGCKLIHQELSADAKTETHYYKIPGLKNILDGSGKSLGSQGAHVLTLKVPAGSDEVKVGSIYDLKIDKTGNVTTAVANQRSKTNSIASR